MANRNRNNIRNRKKNSGGNMNSGSSKLTLGGINTQALNSTASLSWTNSIGGPDSTSGLDISIEGNHHNVPGVMVLSYIPTYGVSNGAESAVNMASKSLYTAVRQRISGARTYEHTNLFMYYVAMDSLYSLYNWAIRAMRLTSNYSLVNRYMPEDVIEGTGWDRLDLVNHLADFKGAMHIIKSKIDSFAVPANCPLFRRHEAMTSNIYADSVSEKAQLYVFNPKGYYVYDELSNPGLVTLKFVEIDSSTKMTTSAFITLMNDLLSKLNSSADVITYSADIATAFEGNIYKLVDPDDSRLDAVYDEDVLLAIHNADVQYMSWSNLDITESVDSELQSYLICNPTAVSRGYDSKIVVDTIDGKTSPEDVLNMTRFKVAANWDQQVKIATRGGLYVENTFKEIGSEVITGVKICASEINKDTGKWAHRWYEVGYDISDFTIPTFNYVDPEPRFSVTNMAQVMALVDKWTKFKLAPFFNIYHLGTGMGQGYGLVGRIGDMDNYAVIGEDVLNNINALAINNLLGIGSAD